MMYHSFFWILVPSQLVYTVAQDPEDLVDTTPILRPVIVTLPEFGKLQGVRQSGVGGTNIDFFGAIPYAAPPVGTRRWAPPEPPPPWAPSTYNAMDFGHDCWQLLDPLGNPGAELDKMSEDCLFVNVYTPAGQSKRKKTLLPVLVWLHGGAFQQGGARRAEYDGRRLAERGTIVVTMNYRLGALGFLVSSPDGLFGNFGLMDQRAALHWVQQNIRYFGGDPDNVTLFGESAGAVMAVLHLMMNDAGRLFHKVAIQSNPLGLQFRSVVIADFIGEALKQAVDCRDLACLRAERVEEIMRAQSLLMGMPRSVGDFFTWGPILTHELKLTVGGSRRTSLGTSSSSGMFRDLDSWKWQNTRDSSWATVNVSQPLKDFDLIPDDIPIIFGSNKHEGEMFVHGAFPITMSKAVYWMFVGALFRDSASRVLKHYRGYVDQIEKEAEQLAQRQIEEEKNRQYYMEHQVALDEEYQRLLDLNASKTAVPKRSVTAVETLLETWSRGGAHVDDALDGSGNSNTTGLGWYRRMLPSAFGGNVSEELRSEKARLKEERRKERIKQNALKEAAKVVVDYRPVMSRIIDDYLFRCPMWHLAQSLSRHRLERGHKNNVYVYQFSHSTHIPGYKECWGKSCHTSELPYVFQAMDIIRSNYSTLGPHAQREAPEAPVYPYTDILTAYREAAEAAERLTEDEHDVDEETTGHTGFNHSSHSLRFQRILQTFFGDYFKEDADEEIASDMADRWVAFAKTGDPNYEGSRADWRPWRYVFDEDLVQDDDTKTWERQDFDQLFQSINDDDNEEDDTVNVTSKPATIEGYVWSDDPQELAFRQRALKALGMEVVEEDVFQTMLKRTPKQSEETDNPFRILFGSSSRSGKTKGGPDKEHTRRATRQLQQIAQEMGLVGTGLTGEPRRGNGGNWIDDFFPEILELKWPPEGRLVERDCTCDFWDRIRCTWTLYRGQLSTCHVCIYSHSLFLILHCRPILSYN